MGVAGDHLPTIACPRPKLKRTRLLAGLCHLLVFTLVAEEFAWADVDAPSPASVGSTPVNRSFAPVR
jgi:hypothetical protein